MAFGVGIGCYCVECHCQDGMSIVECEYLNGKFIRGRLFGADIQGIRLVGVQGMWAKVRFGDGIRGFCREFIVYSYKAYNIEWRCKF
jgi:hypothetical protein